MAAPSAFAKRLSTIAQEQHARFQFVNEADPALCRQIEKWTTDRGSSFSSCTKVPWSAVFVSWCVRQAGASPAEFRFSAAHSVFVHAAIKNAVANVGVFHGLPFEAHAPGVGDIVQHNRGGNSFDFEFARTHKNYVSHSMIVIEVGEDNLGRFAFCIGGNESDSIRRSVVRLKADGTIKPRPANAFISVIQTLK